MSSPSQATSLGRFQPTLPTRFNGSNDPVEVHYWINRMRVYLAICGINLETTDAVLAAASYLEDDAFNFYVQGAYAPAGGYKSFDSFAIGLVTYSLPANWQSDLVDEYNTIKQRRGESIKDLASRLQRLRTCLPAASMPELFVTNRFIAALDPEIRQFVASSKESRLKLADVIAIAKRYEPKPEPKVVEPKQRKRSSLLEDSSSEDIDEGEEGDESEEGEYRGGNLVSVS